MADYDPTLLDTHGSGTDFDLAKKNFAANHMAKFYQEATTWNQFPKETLTNAVSTEIIKTGLLDAEFHTPSAQITGQTMSKTPVVVRLEDLQTISYIFLSERDQLITHWDASGAMSFETGSALARLCNTHTLRAIAASAKTAAVGTFPGGQTLDSAVTGATIAAAFPVSPEGSKLLQNAIAEIVQKMREDNVPMSGEKYVAVNHYLHRVLRQDDTLLSADYVQPGMSDKLTGKLLKVEDCWVVPTNDMPTAASYTTPLIASTAAYNVDNHLLAALVYTTDCIRIVQSQGIATSYDWDFSRLHWQIGGRLMKGIATYRPECAGQILIAG